MNESAPDNKHAYGLWRAKSGFRLLPLTALCNLSLLRGSVEAGTNGMTVRIIIGAAVGGALGFAAYKFIGCASGTCPLTGNPWVSTLLGFGLGAMFTSKPNLTEQNTKSKADRKSK